MASLHGTQQHRTIWQAMVKRSAFASLIYVVLWCLVSMTGVVPEVKPSTSIILWTVFLTVPFARFALLHYFDFFYRRLHIITWHLLFTVLATAPVIAWSATTLISLLQGSPWEVSFALVFALVGLVSGGVNTFSPVMYQVVIFLSVMLFPPAYVIAYMETDFPPMVSSYFLLYWAGMLLVGQIQHQELKASVENGVKLERASYIDPLTGLANRRHFYKVTDEICEVQKAPLNVVVVAVDIDRFKAINDKYGHTVGDECLKTFAHLFQDTFGAQDPNTTTRCAARDHEPVGARGMVSDKCQAIAHCIRMGGEEFLALFFDADSAEVEQRARGLLNTARHSRVDVAGESIAFTVSGGLAQGSVENAEQLQQLIDRADMLLYQAKTNGRDRIES